MARSRPLRASARPSPIHPGAVLRKDVLPALGVTASAAARVLGVSRQTLYNLVNEQTALSPEMAARLGKLCGNGTQFWLALQQAHDLWRVEHELADELSRIPTMRAA